VKLLPVAQDIWLAQYPQRLLGIDFGRNVTIIRLGDGSLVIHSTAPFDSHDLMAIRELGRPGWLLDATLFHDTYAKEGCRAFAKIPYFAPRGFKQIAEVTTQPLDVPPPEWAGQLDVLGLEGIPKTREHVFFHRASRTLIVADLLFHFPAESRGWTRFFVRNIMRLPRLVGVSAFLQLMVKDKAAFTRSLEQIMQWDFERIIVGHGDVVSVNAKALLRQTLADRGFVVGESGV
jgi:glyoxylase-like metal-dependent hydrolase (beta-lactamase superfamily II)